MYKLKMLSLAAVAAATIGTGALVTAPSASAQRAEPTCGELWRQYEMDWQVWRVLYRTGYGNTITGSNAYFQVESDEMDLDDYGCS